jgi:hypothetical protein
MKKALCCLLAFVILHYTQAQSPTIISNAPTSGAVDANFIIKGTGFKTKPANNEVFFGATRAMVSAATATSLIISGEKGQKFPAVLIENYLNQGKNVIFKMEGDIHFNASIQKNSTANAASLQIISTNKGKIIFGNHAIDGARAYPVDGEVRGMILYHHLPDLEQIDPEFLRSVADPKQSALVRIGSGWIVACDMTAAMMMETEQRSHYQTRYMEYEGVGVEIERVFKEFQENNRIKKYSNGT